MINYFHDTLEEKQMKQPTELQKAAADNIIAQKLVSNKINKGKALREAGYSETIANNPQLVTESQGFKHYMAKYGFTEDNLAQLLAEDIVNKPGERLGELKFAAELMGLLTKDVNLNVTQIDESRELMKRIINGSKE